MEINLIHIEAVCSLLGENTYTKLNALVVSIIDPNPCKIQFYAWYNSPDFNAVYSNNFYLAESSQQQKIQKFQLRGKNFALNYSSPAKAFHYRIITRLAPPLSFSGTRTDGQALSNYQIIELIHVTFSCTGFRLPKTDGTLT
jgi:hypothetical protein